MKQISLQQAKELFDKGVLVTANFKHEKSGDEIEVLGFNSNNEALFKHFVILTNNLNFYEGWLK